MSCVISKANIQLYFVNVPVQRRKAVIAIQCPLIESKHKADVFHFSLYLHPFIGSNHKNGVPLPFLSLPSPFYTLQRTDNKSFMRNVKSDSKWKTKRSSSRVNIKTASWWDVLDSWMCWIFGCVGYLDVLDIWMCCIFESIVYLKVLYIWKYYIFGWVGYDRVRNKAKARICG